MMWYFSNHSLLNYRSVVVIRSPKSNSLAMRQTIEVRGKNVSVRFRNKVVTRTFFLLTFPIFTFFFLQMQLILREANQTTDWDLFSCKICSCTKFSLLHHNRDINITLSCRQSQLNFNFWKFIFIELYDGSLNLSIEIVGLKQKIFGLQGDSNLCCSSLFPVVRVFQIMLLLTSLNLLFPKLEIARILSCLPIQLCLHNSNSYIILTSSIKTLV